MLACPLDRLLRTSPLLSNLSQSISVARPLLGTAPGTTNRPSSRHLLGASSFSSVVLPSIEQMQDYKTVRSKCTIWTNTTAHPCAPLMSRVVVPFCWTAKLTWHGPKCADRRRPAQISLCKETDDQFWPDSCVSWASRRNPGPDGKPRPSYDQGCGLRVHDS